MGLNREFRNKPKQIVNQFIRYNGKRVVSAVNVKLSFIHKGKIKTFSHKEKLREFLTTRLLAKKYPGSSSK